MLRKINKARVFIAIYCIVFWYKLIEIFSPLVSSGVDGMRSSAKSILDNFIRRLIIILFNAIAIILFVICLPYILAWFFRFP